MKTRLTALFLCVLLLAGGIVSPAGALVTVAQKTLAKEGAAALWELVNTHYATSMYRQAGYADLSIWCPDGPVFAAEAGDNLHPQTKYVVMMQETAGTGFTIEKISSFISVPWNDFVEDDRTSALLPDGPVHIDPYGSFSYRSGCPSDGNTRYEVIVAAGKDDNGHPLEFYGVIQRLNVIPDMETAAVKKAGNPLYDTVNLRYGADYEREVAEDVWWVPVVSLGKSGYTNADIAAMVTEKPEAKQKAVSTLYEALQLFQISNFSEADDNVRIMENRLDWEHHKPGYDAVRTNEGCCASDSNWLNYILKGDYEQVGFLAYSQQDGSGHIINYIYHDGFYYFIDLTHYRTDFLDSSAPETGDMGDYRNSDFVSGNLHKARTPEAYVQYCVDSFNDPPARFFLYQAEDCLPICSGMKDGKMTIFYPQGTEIKEIDGKDADRVAASYEIPPKEKNDWSKIKDAQFSVDGKYLAGGGGEGKGPLTPYKPGDVLSLEDYGEKGFAEIDGKDYCTCTSGDCWFGFEADLYFEGGNTYSYVDVTLVPARHRAFLENAESLVLGDINFSILRRNKVCQVIVCTREGGSLTVQEVNDQMFSGYKHMSITKDEDGRWKETPEYWVLMVYGEEDPKYEFGRFKCHIR